MYRRGDRLARVLIDRELWESLSDEVLSRFFSIFIPVETSRSDYLNSFEYLVSNKNLDKYTSGQMIALHPLSMWHNGKGEIEWIGLHTSRGLVR